MKRSWLFSTILSFGAVCSAASAGEATLILTNGKIWTENPSQPQAQAVHAYTVGSAFAEHQETVKGIIAPGKLADLVVLTDDIFAIAPEAIEKTKVEMTIFDGKVIYRRS